MLRDLLNVASSAVFVGLLGYAMWWARRGERHWSSDDGMRCICQMRISGDGLEHPWHEVRLLIIPSARAVAVTAKGHRGKLFRGTWNLLGTPHASLIGDVAPDQQTFAVHKQGNNEQTAIVRMSSASASAVIMRNCLPEIS